MGNCVSKIMASGEATKEMLMKIENVKERARWPMILELGMRALFSMVNSMATKAYITGLMVMSMKVLGRMESVMALAFSATQMVLWSIPCMQRVKA